MSHFARRPRPSRAASRRLYAPRGFAKAGNWRVVIGSAATEWILQQGAVAWYGAYADNIPSLRIARRLGFRFVCQMFGA